MSKAVFFSYLRTRKHALRPFRSSSATRQQGVGWAILAHHPRTPHGFRSKMVGKLPTLHRLVPPTGPQPVNWWATSPTLLSKLTFHQTARPLRVHPPHSDIAMDRRIRPIHRPLHQPMLYRVAPTIGHMRPVIGLVPDRVLPKPPLPDPAFPFRHLAGRAMSRVGSSAHRSPHRPRKPVFDLAPPLRIRAITRRQGSDRMQVIGQDDHRIAENRGIPDGSGMGGGSDWPVDIPLPCRAHPTFRTNRPPYSPSGRTS